MDNLVWVGIRESEIKYSDFVNNSISIFGGNEHSLDKQIGHRINHNDDKNGELMNDFYNREVSAQIEKNPNVKFMYYSQIYSYDCMRKFGLLDHVFCLNDQNLINFVNDKFKIKKYLKDYIPVLKCIFLNGKECNYSELKQKYGGEKFVAQTESGSGGFGTIVLDGKNIDLGSHTYMITKYCEGNIPINIHVLISKNDILFLPPSIQIIDKTANNLAYKGGDFIMYKKLVTPEIDAKVKNYTYVVAEKLKERGYQGLLGIDSIIYDNEVYFMEINPRFQNSSTILNKALKENNLPSLQELQYECFYGELPKIESFEVNYNGYVNEFEALNRNFGTDPVEKLDLASPKITYEKSSYVSTDIYRVPIFS